MPGSEERVEELLKAWKNLYENKNAKSGFRIFTGFVGTERPLYLFTTWAANPYEYQNNLVEVIELLGEEGSVLWAETLNNIKDSDTIEGWFLPQYSYTPGK
jgi:hypothetical protein